MDNTFKILTLMGFRIIISMLVEIHGFSSFSSSLSEAINLFQERTQTHIESIQ